MKLIFYDEASEILGTSQEVLRQAASRGDLTRVGTEGNRQRLIKEQVMLFTGINPRTGHKKRISYNALSTEEQALWKRYADEIAHGPGAPGLIVDEEKLAEAVRRELARQKVEELRQKAAAAREEEERFRKENPFLKTLAPVGLTA